MPLVSILVPVYNVEKYIVKCLESLLAQTYPNIEIVLINDGSTDNSLKICQEYEKNHSNIHVYSYENKGISTTRNRALDNMHGDYLMFVDSDDFISKHMIEKMMERMQKEQCDIVMCGFVMDYYTYLPLFRPVASNHVFDSIETLHRMISNKGINNYPWAKLYAASTFENVRFPENTYGFEDTRTIFKAIMKANKIATMPNRYYHYVQRRGSLTNRMSLHTVLDMKKAYLYQQQYLKEQLPEEHFDYDMNFYNIDMVIIYTLLLFVKRQDHPEFHSSIQDWEQIAFPFKFAYVVWLKLACIKFGWKLKEIDWNE